MVQLITMRNSIWLKWIKVQAQLTIGSSIGEMDFEPPSTSLPGACGQQRLRRG